MGLSVEAILATKKDDQLFELLSGALQELFPPELQEDRDRFIAALANAPRGLRAMAGIYDLDVSITVDDLAWHFGNHNDERFLEETVLSLKELEASEVADIFLSAWQIVSLFLVEIRNTDWTGQDFSEYLKTTGIQSKIDPLSERVWAICKQRGRLGLMQYWLVYARKYPERCVKPS